jgi:Fe-S-cluster containining protein
MIALVHYLLEKGQYEGLIGSRIDEIVKDAEVQDRSSLAGWFGKHTPCPFLVDKECSVYGMRPQMCRSHTHLGPVSMCENGETLAIDTLLEDGDSLSAQQALASILKCNLIMAPLAVNLVLAAQWVIQGRDAYDRTVSGTVYASELDASLKWALRDAQAKGKSGEVFAILGQDPEARAGSPVWPRQRGFSANKVECDALRDGRARQNAGRGRS